MTTVRITLDRSSPIPLYHQIASAIEAEIRSGTLTAGSRIETEMSLAARLGVSRPTARQAFQELVEKRLLVRRRGVGTQVASTHINRPVELTSLHEDLNTHGQNPQTQVLGIHSEPADATVAAAMSLDLGTPLTRIDRLRLADGEPLALLTNFIPDDLAPTAVELETRGLYEALRERGVQLHVAHQTIGARIATPAEARQLGDGSRSALLTMKRTTFDHMGRAIEYGSHVYRSSRYSFDTTLFAR